MNKYFVEVSMGCEQMMLKIVWSGRVNIKTIVFNRLSNNMKPIRYVFAREF
jgi:hypothetical protein